MEHFVTKCKKAKSGKNSSKAFITKKKDWADSSDSNEEVNCALMVNFDTDSAASTDKVPQTCFAYDTDNISKLRLFLMHLHTIFKNQSLENERIKYKMFELVKRNDHLEVELIFMLEIQKKR